MKGSKLPSTMPRQGSAPTTGARPEAKVKQPRRSVKRKQRAQSSIIIQSQDDGGDEVVWKLSPTAERLHSAATGKPRLGMGVGGDKSVLQPCENMQQPGREPVQDILSKSSKCSAVQSMKKKKSPDMAGKLELWLSSSHHQAGVSQKIQSGDGNKDMESVEDKENVRRGKVVNQPEPVKETTPTTSKSRLSSSKRPPTSTKRHSSLSAQRNASASSSKTASKQPGRGRKALLDLLDKVDDALVMKSPALIQTKLAFNRKESSFSGVESQTESKPSENDEERSANPLPQPAAADPTGELGKEPSNVEVLKLDPHAAFEARGSSARVLQTVHLLDARTESTSKVVHSPELQSVVDPVNHDERIPCQPVQEERPTSEMEDPARPLHLEDALGRLMDSDEYHTSTSPLEVKDPVPASARAVSSQKDDDNYRKLSNGCNTGDLAPSSGPQRITHGIEFLVLEVVVEDFANSPHPEKILTLYDEQAGVKRFACLRDTWFHAIVKPGDLVNVIGDFDENGRCVINRTQNLLVISPDILVSGSKVGSSFACPRRAVLDERVKSNDVTYPALMGTMSHQLFQVALRSEAPTADLLKAEAALIVKRQVDGLFTVGVSEKEAAKELISAVPNILHWWQRFIGFKTAVSQEVEFGNQRGVQQVSVTEVLDIEEMIWSPKYGLKGMTDASISVKMSNVNIRDQAGPDYIMPFELKTGRVTNGQAATDHRAQVILYTLLMSDRYMQKVGTGLLYYLQTNQTQGVEVQHPELAGLLMRRNDHVDSVLKASANQSLPAMIQKYHMCQPCRHLATCTLYHKAHDGGTGESSGLGELFEESTSHLTDMHLQFFQKWDRLIDLEARDALITQGQIWRMPSWKREERGRCIASLILDVSASPHENNYCFRRSRSHIVDPSNPFSQSTQLSQTSLQDRHFSCGDHVLLSTETGHPGVASGTVVSIAESSIVVSLPRRLRIPGELQKSTNGSCSAEILWRIDKDETASTMAMMRFNLLQLFMKAEGDEQRRKLIVDLQAPKFEGRPIPDSDPAAVYLRSVRDLNDQQIQAIQSIVSAKDYALVVGLPGTGKTSTIVHAVMALLARKASVLLTSYTNSAIDNILLRLKRLGADFIRVGRKDVVHPDLLDKTLGVGLAASSVREYQSLVEETQVVGVTCLGVNHALFGKKKFDFCIVDEAGQITLPVCVGPLRCARSFVLVGDHYQLPPLVRSPEAREDGMASSLLRRLSEAHPQSVSVLQSQYRMCADIMALSNSLIYNDRLRCGNALVEGASLDIPEPSSHSNYASWLLQAVNPMQRLLFLDTDNLPAEEVRKRNHITNPTEGAILLKIVLLMRDGGVEMDRIGVISPYNAQVDHIQRSAARMGFYGLEVHTVDKYQGREKDCVLISFVRSSDQLDISGSLLADWRRVNVAITRAKKKLIMIGSRKTLSSTPILRFLIQKVAEVGSLLQLPSNATSW